MRAANNSSCWMRWSFNEPCASWVETVSYLMLTWLVPGSCEMERMPVMEDSLGAATLSTTGARLPNTWYSGANAAAEAHDENHRRQCRARNESDAAMPPDRR